MAYAFMTRNQDQAGRLKIDRILRGPEGPSPKEMAEANRTALGQLAAMGFAPGKKG